MISAAFVFGKRIALRFVVRLNERKTIMRNKSFRIESTDWTRLQIWLQEATMVLEYCTRLAIAKRTGDVKGAMTAGKAKGNRIFLLQMDMDACDGEIGEALIRKYVVNIGKLAEAGWKTNEVFPVFDPTLDA